ncbi:hypothetical protein BDN71DRAFT_1509226 [Pleurotus eryngii]|uniref:Uncharacterized protein n=1 Tax=Pleurotus eryngii TaxID=5323 RepID=A0A9P5ZQT7_PLEER|nr:hypothetical protein BDN71DRAFT_1509226 [Pleurotus eryngii]
MSSTQLSRTHTIAGPDEQERKEKGTLSRTRKLVPGVLCSAQFFNIFIGNTVVVSLPLLGEDLHFTPGTL